MRSSSVWWDEDDGIPQKAKYDQMRPEDRPEGIQQLYEWAGFRESERFQIWRRAAYLESKIPEPPPRKDGTKRKKPCIAVGIVVDREGNRWYLIAISNLGDMPREVLNEMSDGEVNAGVDNEYLHAEERIIKHIQKLNNNPKYAGRDFTIEAIAAAFPICWRRCQKAMREAGIRPASPLKPVSVEALPQQSDDDPPYRGQSHDPPHGPPPGRPGGTTLGPQYRNGPTTTPANQPNTRRRPKR